MEIRPVREQELPKAMDLCWRVFQEFEAPSYPPEGTEAFQSYLTNAEKRNHLIVYGAWEGEALLGVLAAEEEQIALLFVEPAVHRRGIGRLLFQAFLRESGLRQVSVHSSPYAVEAYRRLGFLPTAEEQHSPDGIRYTPMVWRKSESETPEQTGEGEERGL